MEFVMTNNENDRVIKGQGTPESAWQRSAKLAGLPEVDPESLVPTGARAVIVAPHPDDEILGTGGLMARLSDLGRKILIVAVTNGTASHPDSPVWPASRLADTRPRETHDALQRLRIRQAEVVRLDLPDGGGSTFEADLASELKLRLQPGDVVFGTWRFDGHPDHESVGRAVSSVASDLDLPFVEIPVWTWHWATPDDTRVPWSRARRISLDRATLARKIDAVSAFRSQLEADESTGRDAILPEYVIERLTRPYEVVLI